MIRRSLFILFTGLLISNYSIGSETDQYLALNKVIEDSTTKINHILKVKLNNAILKTNRRNRSCYKLTKTFMKEISVGKKTLMDVPLRNNKEIDQIPYHGSNKELFYDDSIFYGIKRFDLGNGDNRYLSPTFEINGVRLGGDKISHISYIGYSYYVTFYYYFKYFKKKFPLKLAKRKAIEKAINFGIFQENSITGKSLLVAGLFSYADMEANYQGLRLYYNICQSTKPYVKKVNGKWSLQKEIDIRSYITPELDETYYPNYYMTPFWIIVRENLKKYCNKSSFKALQKRWRYYSTFKKKSFSYHYLKNKIIKGELEDPSPFTLENVCYRTK